MKITDELMAWAKEHLSRSSILAIADRIDAEHEETIQQALMGEGGVPATDENMAEYGWVRLPVDAEGKYIHIGDVMVYADGDTCPLPVVALVPPAIFLTDEGPRYADMCRHQRHQPDTWERIIEDALSAKWSSRGERSADFYALVDRCKALAGDVE